MVEVGTLFHYLKKSIPGHVSIFNAHETPVKTPLRLALKLGPIVQTRSIVYCYNKYCVPIP
jgi:hypothetical protein